MADADRTYKVRIQLITEQQGADPAKVIGDVGKKAEEAKPLVEKLGASHRELHAAIRLIERASPEMGAAMAGALLGPVAGAIIGARALLEEYRGELEADKKAADEAGKAAAESFGEAFDQANALADAIERATVAVDEFNKKLAERHKLAEDSAEFDAHIARIKEEVEAWKQLAVARARAEGKSPAEISDIGASYETGGERAQQSAMADRAARLRSQLGAATARQAAAEAAHPELAATEATRLQKEAESLKQQAMSAKGEATSAGDTAANIQTPGFWRALFQNLGSGLSGIYGKGKQQEISNIFATDEEADAALKLGMFGRTKRAAQSGSDAAARATRDAEAKQKELDAARAERERLQTELDSLTARLNAAAQSTNIRVSGQDIAGFPIGQSVIAGAEAYDAMANHQKLTGAQQQSLSVFNQILNSVGQNDRAHLELYRSLLGHVEEMDAQIRNLQQQINSHSAAARSAPGQA